jgi:hypothetical protein
VTSALVPAFLFAAFGVGAALRYRARRRFQSLKISGGRKALALYLADRGP